MKRLGLVLGILLIALPSAEIFAEVTAMPEIAFLTWLFRGSPFAGQWIFPFLAVGVVLLFVSLLWPSDADLRGASLTRVTSLGADADEAQALQNSAHVVVQLSKNFDHLRRMTMSGFIIAAAVMVAGAIVIMAGAVPHLLPIPGLTGEQPIGAQRDISYFTVIAGAVIEVMSAAGMYLFSKTFLRLNEVTRSLEESWRFQEAFRFADALTDDDKAKTIKDIIRKMITPTS